ncbi:methyltransferase family protein [Amycolatopsis echigonensis]|uniref:Methyltransferase family protein n=1 Tax=Amycolatopsis echigonensis TaxID=2576905 RepID=A0A2N3WH80_9PSEU|nr:class I SAM-dependent methyltransferase [Amycolatopsis niigatensis]PKV93217.1 methyltransferase family protein [Amycolatopsis niigatensis]
MAPSGESETTQFWEDLYRSREQVFSGEPNGVLVTEVEGLPPGQALDVGCGEGADARWLAARGWQVTAIDISRTALQRAAAANAGIAWVCSDLAGSPLPAGAFDLVSVQYFPLRKDDRAVRKLLDAVAPGGTFLFASHDPRDLGPEHSGYCQPDDIARVLGDGWTVLVNESRPRVAPAPPGTAHTRDTVLRAQRTRQDRN